jgi:aryl-alcohol dehydrogenase-like predicted oxidoreductase
MTPLEEVLRAVDDLVRMGKVLYFAFSDTPAWVVSQAVATAELCGWTRPIGIQFPYSVLGRSAERDIMPMARSLDLAMLPWGLLEGGVLTGKYNDPQDTTPKREGSASERERQMASELVALAGELERRPSQVAINWVRQQPGLIIPILGARTEAQIKDNLGALEFSLTDEQLQQLAAAAGFKVDFPLSFLTSDHVRSLIFGETFALIDNHRPQLI